MSVLDSPYFLTGQYYSRLNMIDNMIEQVQIFFSGNKSGGNTEGTSIAGAFGNTIDQVKQGGSKTKGKKTKRRKTKNRKTKRRME